MVGLVTALAGFAAVAAHGADVVINEIMYHPPQDRQGLQYIELFNPGAAEVDLSGWSLRKGVKFTFRKNSRLAAGGFIVVCRATNDFIERYGAEPRLAGEFSGKLSHSGETLELSDASHRLIDTVKYSDRAPWPLAADGGSAALERISPRAPGADPANWGSSVLPRFVAPAGTPGKTNDVYSAHPPPTVNEVERIPPDPRPGQPVIIRATVTDMVSVQDAALLFRVFDTRGTKGETTVPMRRVGGDDARGRYEGTIPPQPEGSLVRYRIRASGKSGAVRFQPPPNDLRAAWSFATFRNTNEARIPFAFVWEGAAAQESSVWGIRGRGFASGTLGAERARPEGALLLMGPDGGSVQLFDPVRVTRRNSGFKLHFPKDDTLQGMAAVNVIFETARSTLSEPLSFDLYRMAGVPSPAAFHWRVWLNGQPRGHQLVFEQPDKSFLTRHHRDDSGNLYKLIWYGNGVTGQHEKKTNLQGDHEDLIGLIRGIEESHGDDQWRFIEKNFNVTNFIDYFAVNMCIQNWDGFFNNYFTYHDVRGTGRWEIYPWDEDKTWGDYDGASLRYDWYSMPLTFGMNGDQPPGSRARPGAASPRMGMRAGSMWWRAPGWFSGPLLANAQFRKRFLIRLREIVDTLFIPQEMTPIIDALEHRLEPEIAPQSMPQFRRDIQSFRNQVAGRRQFILGELEKSAK